MLRQAQHERQKACGVRISAHPELRNANIVAPREDLAPQILRPSPALSYYPRKSWRAARKFQGRHFRSLLAGIHGCLATPPPRLDAG
jgi:hypothetical protein